MYHAREKMETKINAYKKANLWFKSYVSNKKFKKRIIFILISLIILGIFSLETFYASKAQATAGILHQINFQGKLVNSNGTNVADGSYDIVFKIYKSYMSYMSNRSYTTSANGELI